MLDRALPPQENQLETVLRVPTTLQLRCLHRSSGGAVQPQRREAPDNVDRVRQDTMIGRGLADRPLPRTVVREFARCAQTDSRFCFQQSSFRKLSLMTGLRAPW